MELCLRPDELFVVSGDVGGLLINKSVHLSNTFFCLLRPVLP